MERKAKLGHRRPTGVGHSVDLFNSTDLFLRFVPPPRLQIWHAPKRIHDPAVARMPRTSRSGATRPRRPSPPTAAECVSTSSAVDPRGGSFCFCCSCKAQKTHLFFGGGRLKKGTEMVSIGCFQAWGSPFEPGLLGSNHSANFGC